MVPAKLAATLFLVASIGSGSTSAAVHQYTVSVDPRFETLAIQACFDGKAPTRLAAASRRARDYLNDPRSIVGGDSVPLSVSRAGIRTAAVADNGCVAYGVDAGRAVRDGVDRNGAHTDHYLMLRASYWLWLPTDPGRDDDVAIAFRLPDDIAVSAPWRPTARGRFRLGGSPSYWPALVAIGRFNVEPVTVSGATLRLAVLPGEPVADRVAMRDWIAEAANAVADLYGSFPVPSPQVIVVPSGPRTEPVPWGQVLRGGMPAAHFFVDQTRPLSEFRADWTAAHELSHMLMPYMGTDNAWLSEGFASYYQNVLRARAGLLDERDAWQKLHDGFRRGVRGTRGLRLGDASRNMRRDGAYMRVYWSGAAVALKADVAIRQQTDGRHSLATALAGLKTCCLPAERRWSAQQLVARLDALTGTDVMSALHRQHVNDRRFPNLEAEYERLGLTLDGDRIRLDDTAPLAAIRGDIMGTRGRGAGRSQGAG